MNIRLLNSDDITIYREFRIQAIHESPHSFGESAVEVTKKSLASFSAQLQSHGRGDFVLGAFDEATHLTGVVGFYRAIPSNLSHKGTLWGMYVAPGKRHQGIGSTLVTAAIERAGNLPGILSINLCVTASNVAARRLYESKGFQVYGIEPKALCIDGVYFDEVLMQLMLSPGPFHFMRRRPSSRLLVIDQHNRILLFRFVHKTGALAGKDYWATPGGAVEEGETFVDAARRELFEETGIVIGTVGGHIAEREFILQMPDGENVIAQERFFVVRTTSQNILRAHWTTEEIEVVADYKWWSIAELTTTQAVVFPDDMVAILGTVGLIDK
ncbi:MAG: GCN5-related N-acetyltransferase [Solimicrobium sp.]|jgi:8-oxo-dGTP pyrophosphatase MutT (NUDIX family)/ribosomal protein S18 acetylase RimI-like enzyme|nr:GCN5-related N-acetyltransferase [Solimicrobium sp.]